MLPEDELDLLKILWDASGPLTMQNILKKSKSSDFDKVSAALQQMEKKQLVQSIETVAFGSAYAPTEKSRKQILQDVLEVSHSVKNIISPCDLGIKIMEAALNGAESPEEKLGVIEEFEEMIADLER